MDSNPYNLYYHGLIKMLQQLYNLLMNVLSLFFLLIHLYFYSYLMLLLFSLILLIFYNIYVVIVMTYHLFFQNLFHFSINL